MPPTMMVSLSAAEAGAHRPGSAAPGYGESQGQRERAQCRLGCTDHSRSPWRALWRGFLTSRCISIRAGSMDPTALLAKLSRLLQPAVNGRSFQLAFIFCRLRGREEFPVPAHVRLRAGWPTAVRDVLGLSASDRPGAPMASPGAEECACSSRRMWCGG